MKALDPVGTFASLSREAKVRFLVHLAFELTIAARQSYEAGTETFAYPARVRAINELQHVILGYLSAFMADDPRRYPEDLLIGLILENEADRELQRQVHNAFDRAVAFV